MTATQYPIDGKKGKAWKVTDYMGWRIHPIKKVKKYHNGTDIVAGGATVYLEAWHDGKIIAVGWNPTGFGQYVILLHKIGGKYYTSLYAHMIKGSVKVKKGQRVTAGTVLGKMGSTGASTGRHLHLEIHKGKKHTWSSTGVGYIEPVGFIAALIAKEQAEAKADRNAQQIVDEDEQADTPVAPTPQPAPKPVAKPATYKVKRGDTLTAIAEKHGTTVAALVRLNKIKDANFIRVGQTLRLS